MFLMWLLGLGLMIIASFLFYRTHIKYGIPYEKFRFENSNELGILAPRDWDENVKFKNIELKANLQAALIVKPLVLLFAVGLFMFMILTVHFIFGK